MIRSGTDPFYVVTGVGGLSVILAVVIATTGPMTAGKSLEALEASI